MKTEGSGKNVFSRNFNVPISQLPNKLTSTTFDDYVLIGRKDDKIAIYSNSDESTLENWLKNAGIPYDQTLLTQETEGVG